MHVRRAIPDDAFAIETIRVRGWQAAYREILPPAELDEMTVDDSRWRQRLAEPPPGWSTFVADDPDGTVVGFSCVGPSRDEAGVGELYAIYVDPDAWSIGTGQALIKRAEESLTAGWRVATLWVLAENARARRFYEHAGWAHDGARKALDRWSVLAPEVRYRKVLTQER